MTIKSVKIFLQYLLSCCCLVTKLCLTLFSMDFGLPDTSVHGISQARILEWSAISFSRGSFWLRDWTNIFCIGRQILYHWATREVQYLLSVQFSHSVISDSLPPHEPQHARPLCPSPTPRVHPNPCPLSWWCHPTTSSSVVPFSSCPQSFPASGSFPMSQLFASGGQSIARIRIWAFACEWHQPPDSHFISESSFSLFLCGTDPSGWFVVGLVPTPGK